MRCRRIALVLSVCLVSVSGLLPGHATVLAQEPTHSNLTIDPKLYEGLRYRSLNFTRGGRATAVAGVAGDPLVYYFGSTGGGVWKSTDAGLSWTNVSDGFFGVGSIGAIAVAPSDPNIVYVGTGSACPRGNVSVGDGLYRSTDAGKSWTKVLALTGQIGKIVVHPDDYDTAWAAVLGNVFGPSEDRGVYRTTDGGATWEKVLYIDDDTGAVDLEIDPNNPRILLASVWTAERKPWTIDSGSEQDGVYRTKDGGSTWTQLAGGLPHGLVGKSSVAISPADGDRMWVLAEAAENQGGVYRSDDGGDSWRRVNKERKLLQRAWYYIHIYADPKDVDTVYALNTGFYKSTDGGKSFDTRIQVPHGDNHDLWINPGDPRVMINSNDGGANVSLNGGGSWTHERNQPTAQIYRVTVDEAYPYRVYGAQQDNSTVRLSSRGGGGGFGGGFGADFDSVGGGESGHIAVDPRTNEIVYAGSYGGTITRRDMDTGLSENVRAYPESQTGQQALDMKYRFQWNAPIRISPHDPDVVYHTSQYVHRTRDGGRTWEVISPDLTTNDPETQGYSGGPITRDNTGVEVFDTIFAFEESPLVPGLLWAGTDDGRVWVSRDDGGNWDEITPPNMPARGTVNMIDTSTHDPGRVLIAVHKYRENDFHPYIFRTDDYGAHWQLLTDGTNGIPADHWVRVVREDPDRRGLLYAGTEFGMYVSFDDGAHWQSLQLNLPTVPVTDLAIHRQDLVVATQGRAFWILDDLTPLQQLQADEADRDAVLFAPRPAVRGPGGSATIDFYLREVPEAGVEIEILDADGNTVRSYSSKTQTDVSAFLPPGLSLEDVPERFRARLAAAGGGLEVHAGLNRLRWDERHSPLFRRPRGIVMWGGGGAGGPKAVPGTYQIRLSIGDDSQTQALQLETDPRLDTTVTQFRQQYELAVQVGEQLGNLWKSLQDLRGVKQQLRGIGRLVRGHDAAREVIALGRKISEQLGEVEGEITQLQGEGGQDALNFPGRLDNQWAVLYSSIANPDTPVPAGARRRLEDLQPQTDTLLARLDQIYAGPLQQLNERVRAMQIEVIPVPKKVSGS